MAPEFFHSLEAKELRDIAGRVKAYQDAEGLTDSALVRLFPDLGSQKTYNAILADDLDELNLERQLVNYQLVIAQIEAGAEKRGARDEERYDDFLGVAQCKKVLMDTMSQRSIARLIIVEGDTGSGKSSICTVLTRKYQGRILNIEATAGWSDSPGAMCASILKASGQKEIPLALYDRLESVLELLAGGTRRRCVMIEEAHHMGVRCLNILKTLINCSPGEFVLFAYPTLWERLEKRAYHEARQLIGNRLAGRIKLTVQPADVKKFVSRRVPKAVETLNGKFDAVVDLLVTKAKVPKHGNMGFVRQVCDRVLNASKGTDGPSYEQFVAAMDQEVQSR